MEHMWLRCLGCRATFRTKVDKVLYSGDIQNVDVKNQTITFFKVTVVDTGKVFNSLQNFHHHEIYDLEVDEDVVNNGLRNACLKMETNRNEGKQKPGKQEKTMKITGKDQPKHIHNLDIYDPTDLQMRQLVEKEMERTCDENGQYESVLPDKCTLLDDCQTQLFKDAIAHLKACGIVGVAFEGIRLGRNGKLCWIVVSTTDHIMFFDMVKMGKVAFEGGLKDLLQSKHIMKVVHDSRLPSDLLFHQYSVNLVNIFDSQVANVYLHKLQHKEFQRFVPSLQDCLYIHLCIDRERLCYPLVRDHCPEEDEAVFAMRPAPSLVYKWMHEHCCHLLALHNRQMDEMMLEFTLGVDIYLSTLRDLNTQEAKIRQERQHVLPLEFMGLEAEIIAIRKQRQRRHGRTFSQRYGASKDSKGREENCNGISHPHIIAGHDTIWHNSIYSKFTGKKVDSAGQSVQKQTDKCNSEPDTRNHSSKCNGLRSHSGPVDRDHTKQHSSHASAQNGTTQGGKTSSSSSSETEMPPRLHHQSRQEAPFSQPLQGRGRGRVDAEQAKTLVLQQLTMDKQKNDRLNPENADVVFRVAGDNFLQPSKKKEHHQSDSDGDLTSRGIGSSQKAEKLTGNEFDAIPYQKALAQKYRYGRTGGGSNATPSFVPAPSSSAGEGGFKIDSFTETVPPPAFIGGNSPRSYHVSARKEALEAILPQVDDRSMLLKGSRSDASRKQAPSDTEDTDSLVRLMEENDKAIQRATSLSLNADVVVSDGELRTSKSTEPFRRNVSGGESEDTLTDLNYIQRVIQQARFSAASNMPPVLQTGPELSAEVNRCQIDSRTSPVHSTTHCTHKQISVINEPQASPSNVTPSSVCRNSGSNVSANSSLKVEGAAAVATATQSPTPSVNSANASVQATSPSIVPKETPAGGKSVMALLGFTRSPQERMMRHSPAKSNAVG